MKHARTLLKVKDFFFFLQSKLNFGSLNMLKHPPNFAQNSRVVKIYVHGSGKMARPTDKAPRPAFTNLSKFFAADGCPDLQKSL